MLKFQSLYWIYFLSILVQICIWVCQLLWNREILTPNQPKITLPDFLLMIKFSFSVDSHIILFYILSNDDDSLQQCYFLIQRHRENNRLVSHVEYVQHLLNLTVTPSVFLNTSWLPQRPFFCIPVMRKTWTTNQAHSIFCQVQPGIKLRRWNHVVAVFLSTDIFPSPIFVWWILQDKCQIKGGHLLNDLSWSLLLSMQYV